MSNELGAWRYEGSWQTPIPNALIFDKRLPATALKLWLVLRAAITPGQTLSPTYDYLGERCNLSRSTVARAVKILRATRWIQTKTLKTESGWLSGSMYRMYDAPTAMADIATIDPDYPNFLSECAVSMNDSGLVSIAHGEIAAWALAGMVPIEVRVGSSVSASGSLKTRLRSMKTELSSSLKIEPPRISEKLGSLKSELLGSLKIELPLNPYTSGSMVSELPHARDVVSSCIYTNLKDKKTTTTNLVVGIETRTRAQLIWPDVVPIEVQGKTEVRLLALPNGMGQELLDEVAYRHLAGKASNAVSLLYGLIPIAEQGKFQVTGGANFAKARNRDVAPASQQTPLDAEQQRKNDHAQYVAQMREYGVQV